MKQPTIISQKTVYKSELFNIVETKLLLDNDKKHIYHDVEVQPTVFIFPLTNENEIYLVREYRYLLKKTVFSAVAGFVKNGETSIQAAKRELKEEAGLIASHWEELLRMNTENSVVKSQKHLFLAQDIEIENKSSEEDEDIEVIKIPLNEAVNKTISGEISGAGSIIGLLLLDKLKRERKI